MMNTVWLVTTALLLSCHLGTAPRFHRTSSSEYTPLLAESSTEDVGLFLRLQPMAYKPKPWDAWYGSHLSISGSTAVGLKVDRSTAPRLVLVELPTPHEDLDIHATLPKTTAFSLDNSDVTELFDAIPFTIVCTMTATGLVKNYVQYVETQSDLNALVNGYSKKQEFSYIACKGDGADRLIVEPTRSSRKRFNMAFQGDMAGSKSFYGYRMYFKGKITPRATQQ